MRFEWDAAKAKINKAKHGIDFELAPEFDSPTWSSPSTTARTMARNAWSPPGSSACQSV
ncbi:MAG: hypothetical protein E5X23_15575 [Mesorhizobium sp.]|nr:MAG: hypothetical protein E5X23_15575 [Mesorhizobium sp.]